MSSFRQYDAEPTLEKMPTLLVVIFVLGYLAIALEHPLKIDKAAPALLIGMLIWTVYLVWVPDRDVAAEHFNEHIISIASILFFLLGAMTVVELMDSHSGFEVITDRITTTNKRKLLWIVGILTFFLSATLDNMTTAIVMCVLMKKLLGNERDRWTFVGLVIIAANAGGAWSPIGDVTTIMLWIKGQITGNKIMSVLIIPSIVALIIPLLWFHFKMKDKTITRPVLPKTDQPDEIRKREKMTVFILGLVTLLGVPLFKHFTHLPPFVGVMLGLAILWTYTEIIHKGDARGKFKITAALKRIEHASIFFFLGILVAVAGLETSGILSATAGWLNSHVGNIYAINGVIGLLSAIVDNVPLVAAAQGMYPIDILNPVYPPDHLFWQALAYCAGTGGSILIIGSAAGVAAQGLTGIQFGWYVKNVAPPAILGYAGGLLTFYVQNILLH